jgi:outer membrane biosynthesis protein TonB
VLPDGTVGEVRVTRSLDRKYRLDDAAVRAFKETRYSLGTKDGVAVPVLVSFEISFVVKR